MASIGGDTGAPRRSPFRSIQPPTRVWIDLPALFPRAPHQRGRYHPGGLQMDKVVIGELSMWGLSEQGAWLGLVTYDIEFGTRKKAVTHWVPAWMLKPTTPGD